MIKQLELISVFAVILLNSYMLFGVCTPYLSLHVHGIDEEMLLLILESNIDMVSKQHNYVVGTVSIGEYC